MHLSAITNTDDLFVFWPDGTFATFEDWQAGEYDWMSDDLEVGEVLEFEDDGTPKTWRVV